MTTQRGLKAALAAAVRATRLYAGSDGKVRVSDAQRLYSRMVRATEKVAKLCGMEPADVSQQVAAEARRLGPITPKLGQDL